MKKSKNEWTKNVWSPFTGCKKIGDGSLDSITEQSKLKSISKAKKSSPKKLKNKNNHE